MAAPETTDALPPVTVPVNTPFTPFSPWDIERIIAIPQEDFREDTATILFTRQLLVNGRHLEMRLLRHHPIEGLANRPSGHIARAVFTYTPPSFDNPIPDDPIGRINYAPYEIEIRETQAIGEPINMTYSLLLDHEKQYEAVVQTMEDGTRKVGLFDGLGNPLQPLLCPYDESGKENLGALLSKIQLKFDGPQEHATTSTNRSPRRRWLPPVEQKEEESVPPPTSEEEFILPAEEDNAETA